MITIKDQKTQFTHILKPTIFPDGTSQVWKLPEEILNAKSLYIKWNFEAEREIFDLYSIKTLLDVHTNIDLSIPYLPFARQDKEVNNNNTFNLEVFAHLINELNFNAVYSIDVHNPFKFYELVFSSLNFDVSDFHRWSIKQFNPDYIVFPDAGAELRYSHESVVDGIPKIIGVKTRDQETGIITNYALNKTGFKEGSRFLIIDDICDGGATFIETARLIRDNTYGASKPEIGLCVTHGIFSKGRQHLLDNGITKLYTTNSLIKNTDGYEV